jgi:hypothetical protein
MRSRPPCSRILLTTAHMEYRRHMTAPIPPKRPAIEESAREPRYPMLWPPITFVSVSSCDPNAPLGRRMRVVKL